MSGNQSNCENGNPIGLTVSAAEKNYGIEMLRILSMVFIVTLHVLLQGGILAHGSEAANIANFPWNYKIEWIWEAAAIGAVDLFGLVSGFVGLRSKWATKKYLRLWLLVVFWGVSMVLLVDKGAAIIDRMNTVFKALIPCIKPDYAVYEFAGTEYWSAIFAVLKRQYWYFNAYTLLFIFMPILNAAISKFTKKQLGLIVCGLFLLTSVYTTIAGKDVFVMNGGNSGIWLIIMYLTGAAVRLFYEDGFKPNKWVCLVGYMFCTALSVGWRFCMDSMTAKHPENDAYLNHRMRLIAYTAPFIVIGSVLLLMLFMQIQVQSGFWKKLIGKVAGASFAVYIIHVQPVFWQYYMLDRFYLVAYEPTSKMILHIFEVIILIYVICTMLELIRQAIFKYTRINNLIDFVGDRIDSLLRKIIA